ncbi:MAG: hypothetical protein V9G29_19415 [Burkholderiaceae bacterium]
MSSVDEDIDTTSTAADALTASGPKLAFADGQVVPVAAVRSSVTHAALTALPVGDAVSHPLELVVPPGRGPAILFARSGEDASLTLGSAAYGLGPVSMVEVSFPPLDAKIRPTSLMHDRFQAHRAQVPPCEGGREQGVVPDRRRPRRSPRSLWRWGRRRAHRAWPSTR